MIGQLENLTPECVRQIIESGKSNGKNGVAVNRTHQTFFVQATLTPTPDAHPTDTSNQPEHINTIENFQARIGLPAEEFQKWFTDEYNKGTTVKDFMYRLGVNKERIYYYHHKFGLPVLKKPKDK